MSGNCRFAFAVHVLSVLALHPEKAITSEELRTFYQHQCGGCAPTLGELSQAGLVESQRGPGGGTRLARPAKAITLAAIYRAASGEIAPFGEHPQQPAQCCPVGRGIGRVLEASPTARGRPWNTSTRRFLWMMLLAPFNRRNPFI
jgi:DNA-binding IscR family transcriptional regulator